MSATQFRLAGITVDCVDAARVAAFWGAVLGREPEPDSSTGWPRIGTHGDLGPVLTFQPVPEPKSGKTRLHLDLMVDDIATATSTVVELGGRDTGERHDYDEGTVVVLADPEGNEFCVVAFAEDPTQT